MGSKTLKITMGILLVVRFAASVASLARGTKKFALPKNDAYRRKAGGKSNPGTDTFSQNTSSASSGLSPRAGRAKMTAVIAPIETPAIISL
jgi:hypothetical protein